MRINKSNLRRILKESKLERQELAKKCGFTFARVCNILNDKSTIVNFKNKREIELILWTINDYSTEFIEVTRKSKVTIKDIVIQS